MSRPGPGAWVLAGALLWLARPVYLLVEYVVAAGVRGTYSFADDTVSDLGVLGCVTAAGGSELCSPRHALMNGSFVVFGVAMALGAVLVAPALGRAGRGGHGWRDGRVVALVVAFVVAGVSSVATGLVPLDRAAGLHYAVALPVFVAQPIGLLLLAWTLWGRTPRLAGAVLLAGVVSVAGAIGFGLLGGGASGRGAVERVALWPTFLALAAVGLATVLRRVDPTTGAGGSV